MKQYSPLYVDSKTNKDKFIILEDEYILNTYEEAVAKGLVSCCFIVRQDIFFTGKAVSVNELITYEIRLDGNDPMKIGLFEGPLFDSLRDNKKVEGLTIVSNLDNRNVSILNTHTLN